ncbi:sigma-70 family RNA polymerase sigma factor [filamentous cyanobacterium LEGE 11480]|uniref:Sigma-70 family RNA polymerase sigma factor n=1 Tax=Romeriopsis navalis LEGE 11480 TaxID=2777977 RepID=A0A928VKU0_9CYAN|nr:sigma-70 family RNA polymerase sigma factor [Romeriopsis navalis]MBE9028207.1 sigma-70 family RNA polymerase sigma factor [Romeriopsis navalis LEGE 11480]
MRNLLDNSSPSPNTPWGDDDADIDGEQLLCHPDHIKRIERIARKQTRGSGLDWQDAAQSAQTKLLKAFRAGKFRQGDAAAFYRWASSVARFEIIDLVRKEKRQRCSSLDQTLSEGQTTWLELVADDFNALDSLVQNDLVEQAIAAIFELDAAQPDKCFLKLWQAKLTGKRQTDLATELGLTQSAISKRWKELIRKLTAHLGWLEPPTQIKAPAPSEARGRSQMSW